MPATWELVSEGWFDCDGKPGIGRHAEVLGLAKSHARRRREFDSDRHTVLDQDEAADMLILLEGL